MSEFYYYSKNKREARKRNKCKQQVTELYFDPDDAVFRDKMISDIQIIFDDELVPVGYIKLRKDLNEGAKGAYIWLCAKFVNKKPESESISNIMVISGDSSNITAPTGYEKTHKDLNSCAGRKVYIPLR